MTAKFDEIPELAQKGSYKVTEAWTGKSLGCKKNKVSMKLEQHDTAVLIVGDSC
jgi:alpha-galactosidase